VFINSCGLVGWSCEETDEANFDFRLGAGEKVRMTNDEARVNFEKEKCETGAGTSGLFCVFIKSWSFDSVVV
jgi:hypothetical protein